MRPLRSAAPQLGADVVAAIAGVEQAGWIDVVVVDVVAGAVDLEAGHCAVARWQRSFRSICVDAYFRCINPVIAPRPDAHTFYRAVE